MKTYCLYPNVWLSDIHLVARVVVISSSIIWALIVLYYEKAFTQTFKQLTQLMPENMWAGLIMITSVFLLWHTWTQRKPSSLTLSANLILSFLWTYTVIGFLAFWTQLPPGGFAACFVVMVLSFVNVLALPKKKE